MNKDQLKKNAGKQVLLRPAAIGAATDGHDDEWVVSDVGDVVELVNLRTEHRVVLGFDAIISFTSDPSRESGDGVKRGFLQLSVQVEIADDGQARIEPLPFARGGNSAANGVNLLRLELRKAVAEAHLELEEVLDLIRHCLKSRIAVLAANGLGRSGPMEAWKQKCAADAKEVGQLKRDLPTETQDFSGASPSEWRRS